MCLVKRRRNEVVMLAWMMIFWCFFAFWVRVRDMMLRMFRFMRIQAHKIAVQQIYGQPRDNTEVPHSVRVLRLKFQAASNLHPEIW